MTHGTGVTQMDAINRGRTLRAVSVSPGGSADQAEAAERHARQLVARFHLAFASARPAARAPVAAYGDVIGATPRADNRFPWLA
jgi:hypothetical protein